VSARPLDELFFEWLYAQVADADVTDPSRTYWKLFKQLYTTEFFWIIPRDDDRIMDGQELRNEFTRRRRINRVPLDWLDLGCSVLELMVGLARRIAFEDLDEGETHYWFWQLLRNLGLDDYTDDVDIPSEDIDEVLKQLIFRTYHPSGRGGFFPLKDPCDDQRDVDLWYQMGAYLLESTRHH